MRHGKDGQGPRAGTRAYTEGWAGSVAAFRGDRFISSPCALQLSKTAPYQQMFLDVSDILAANPAVKQQTHT